MAGLFDTKKPKERKFRLKIEAYDGEKKLFSEEYVLKNDSFFRSRMKKKRKKPKSL